VKGRAGRAEKRGRAGEEDRCSHLHEKVCSWNR